MYKRARKGKLKRYFTFSPLLFSFFFFFWETYIEIFGLIISSLNNTLLQANIIDNETVHELSILKMNGYEENSKTKNSLKLLELSRESVGLSGRALRKIPFLAHSLFLRKKTSNLYHFLRAMHLAVTKQKEDAFF